MKPILYSTCEDYCKLKISLLLALTNVDIDVKSKVDIAEMQAMDSNAKSVLLKCASGYIFQHLAILRFIAQSDSISLLGADEIELAQINQWLEFFWQDLGK